MIDKDILSSTQKKLTRLFLNSRKNDRLSNSYLLVGERTAPLRDIALFLSESLACENSLLACRLCNSCQRFEKGIRPDFMLIDGEEKTIKKEDILNLRKNFSMSALEKNHRLTYCIISVDNITDEAANSLLKFLEEPKEGQVAFLTTHNSEKVLPTIRSRSTEVKIDPLPQDMILSFIDEKPFLDNKEKEISLSSLDRFLLSHLFSSREDMEKAMSSSFPTASFHIDNFLTMLERSSKDGSYALLSCAHQVKDSECYNWIYLSLDVIFKDIIFQEETSFPSLKGILEKRGTDLLSVEKCVREALSLRQINLSNTAIFARIGQILNQE